jgi:regulatory protein
LATRQRLSLKGQALKFLSIREHSRVELRRKMLPHAKLACAPRDEPGNARGSLTEAALEEVGPCLDKLLDWLEAEGLLSQQRFIESRVRTRSAKFGTTRIRRELSMHGMSLPSELRQQLEGSEVERARSVWARKFDGPPADAAAMARQMRFLAARGFSSDAIRRVVRGTSASHAEDD